MYVYSACTEMSKKLKLSG